MSPPPDPQLHSADAICLVPLGLVLMLPLQVVALVGSLDSAALWASLLESAGFVDWPTLSQVTFLQVTASVFVALGAISIAVLTSRCNCYNERLADRLWLVIASMGLAALCWTATYAAFTVSDGESAAMGELLHQHKAVSRYNRLFCLAACPANSHTSALWIQGRCTGVVPSAFPSVGGRAVEEVQKWCKGAILNQSFAYTARHDGFSPFAAFKENLGGPISSGSWYGTSVTLWMLSSIFTATLFVPLVELARESCSSKPDDVYVRTAHV